METPRREGSVLAGLLGGLLLAALVAFVVAGAPVETCPSCEGNLEVLLLRAFPCDCCRDRLKVTLLEGWRWRRGARERALRVDPDRY